MIQQWTEFDACKLGNCFSSDLLAREVMSSHVRLSLRKSLSETLILPCSGIYHKEKTNMIDTYNHGRKWNIFFLRQFFHHASCNYIFLTLGCLFQKNIIYSNFCTYPNFHVEDINIKTHYSEVTNKIIKNNNCHFIWIRDNVTRPTMWQAAALLVLSYITN